MYPENELAQLVLSACVYHDINTVVISPGSRNAPLTIGFSNLKDIKTVSIVDERCAAFFALGVAQQQQKLVAVVCTSGSALLNYYPAIAEAFYSDVPLVVISADRPKHLIDVGDGQTIRQEHVFANHVLFSANLEDKQTDHNKALLSKALHLARLEKGPVHINVPFDEPLYNTTPLLKQFDFSNGALADKHCYNIDFDNVEKLWNSCSKRMVLIGANYPNAQLEQVLRKLIEKDRSIILLTEATSNLSILNSIDAIDQVIFPLADADLEALQPEALLTFGGMVISKKIKQFLRKYPPKYHWHVDEKKAFDTFFCLTDHLKTTPVTFVTNFLHYSEQIQSNYKNAWLTIAAKRQEKHLEYVAEIAHTDLKVMGQILKHIPKHTQLQLSNSAVVRYAQFYPKATDQTVTIFCNRGTSGIDGSTSTAIGAAFASNTPTTLVTGDLSFFYDSNALWNNNIPNTFRIIVINNSGGGIFKILPGPKTTNALAFFETPHNLTAKQLCAMYNLEYKKAQTTTEVEQQLQNFYNSSKTPVLLEIFTPNNTNDTVLKDYFKFIK